MDFLRETFFEPMGVHQELLQARLDLSIKSISDLYRHKRGLTVATAKKFGALVGVSPERLLQMQAAYDLHSDKTQYNVEPLKVPTNTNNLLRLVSKGIGHEVSLKTLRDLFRDNNYKKENELVVSLFRNVPLNKTVKYMLDIGIGLSHLKKIYEYYRLKLGGTKHPHFERLLADDDHMAIEKILNNGKYFTEAREFEQYLFYRLAFMHKKKALSNSAHDKNRTQAERQRAAYLYEFSTGKKENLEFNPKPVKLYENSRRPTQEVNSYGLLSEVDTMRYNQFMTTGNY